MGNWISYLLYIFIIKLSFDDTYNFIKFNFDFTAGNLKKFLIAFTFNCSLYYVCDLEPTLCQNNYLKLTNLDISYPIVKEVIENLLPTIYLPRVSNLISVKLKTKNI